MSTIFESDAFDHLVAKRIQPPDGGTLGRALSAAFRMGHMAIRMDQGGDVYGPQIMEEITKGMYDPGQVVLSPPFISLPYAYSLEERLAAEVKRLVSSAPSVSIVPVTARNLTKEQADAVSMASRRTFCAITGGPGTGKTYTAGMVLRGLPEDRRVRIGLAAPTGRAVQALQASIHRAVGDHPSLITEARTLHSLIREPDSAFLPYHMVLVDECSMVDSALLCGLLKRLYAGTRVLLLGDPDQLPAIDAGQPFFDLVASSAIDCSSLTICQRAESADLMTVATLVREGDANALVDWLTTREGGGQSVHWMPCTGPTADSSLREMIMREAIAPWQSGRCSFTDLRRSVVLTPSRKGPLGADSINAMARKGSIEPVVVSKNSYQLGLMNGDLGLREGNCIHFPQGPIPAVLCPHVVPAYALTVHKSQGSEFETAIVLIPPGSQADRRLLYTAVTRAKKRLVIVADPDEITQTMDRKLNRTSLLPLFLRC